MVIKLGSPLGKLWPQEALKRSLAWFEAAAYEYLQKQRRSFNVPTAQIVSFLYACAMPLFGDKCQQNRPTW